MSTLATLATAAKGDTVEARELPRTTERAGHGWVRTWDGLRSVYVVQDHRTGAWVVRDIEVVMQDEPGAAQADEP